MFGQVIRGPGARGWEPPERDRVGGITAPSAWPAPDAVWAAGDETDPSARSPEPMSLGTAVERCLGSPPAAKNDPERADLSAMSHSELERHLVELVAERCRVEGRYLEALGEYTARVGDQAAAYQLRQITRMNGPQARAEARLAQALDEHGYSETVESMKNGETHMSHAKVIARESPKKHRRSESSFLELAREWPADVLIRHTLAYESNEVFADLAAEAAAKEMTPADAELACQRQQRFATLKCGDDGMWHLRGQFDFLAGRQLSGAFQAMIRKLRSATASHAGPAATVTLNHRSDDPACSGGDSTDAEAPAPTTGQLAADAWCELVLGSESERKASSLIILADYDIANDRLVNPRLDDGTPLSARQLAERAVSTKVFPAVFNADWSKVAIGRTRNANDAQRLILAARDGGCVGCELTSEHTEAHHIEHHEHGGLTEIPNLASLCRPCHTSVHQRHREITTGIDGRPTLDSRVRAEGCVGAERRPNGRASPTTAAASTTVGKDPPAHEASATPAAGSRTSPMPSGSLDDGCIQPVRLSRPSAAG